MPAFVPRATCHVQVKADEAMSESKFTANQNVALQCMESPVDLRANTDFTYVCLFVWAMFMASTPVCRYPAPSPSPYNPTPTPNRLPQIIVLLRVFT